MAAAFALAGCVAPAGQVGGPIALVPAKPYAGDPYAWLDRVDALLDAIADAPPDYSFDHRGQRLFAWDVDDVLIVEEPGADGYVLYLFERGEREPFFVRTPDFAAGFEQRRLAIVYSRDGEILSAADAWRRDFDAVGLQRRGYDLRLAAQRNRWDARAARDWVGVQGFVLETRDAWSDGWRGNRDWSDYRRRSEVGGNRAALRDERRRRRDARDEFRRWQGGGFTGAPPRGGGVSDRPPRGDGFVDRPTQGNGVVGTPPRGADRPGTAGPVPVERPVEAIAPALLPESEPEYRGVAPDRATRPRPPLPVETAPEPGNGRVPISELQRDPEESRRAAEAAELQAMREQEAVLAELRRAEAARAAEQARALEEAEATTRRAAEAAAGEAERQREAERRAAEQAVSADEETQREQAAQAEARTRAEAEARRRAAEQEVAEETRRREEQDEADARARAEQRRREMEPTLSPQRP